MLMVSLAWSMRSRTMEPGDAHVSLTATTFPASYH